MGVGLTITSGAAHLLPRLVGAGRAKELMLTGDWIDAAAAERIGLVNRVVPRDNLMPTVSNLAAKIISRAPLAVAMQNHLLDACADASLDASLRMEVDAILATFASYDGQEDMSAFLDKRATEFRGE